MRKNVTLLTAMLCLMFVFGLNTKAATYGDLTYTVRNGSIVITGCNDQATSVMIPSTIAGKKVTVIGDSAFNLCESLTSVTIPSSVKTIETEAFSFCTSLKGVTIPNSVTTIGTMAFEYCESLTSITIPSGVTTIEKSAFYGCTSLTSVTIPNSVKTIGNSAFNLCESLTSVTIPNSVKTIGEDAFYACTSLKSVIIPSSVTTIGRWAFLDCKSLKSVTIPSSVKTIGDYALGYTCELTTTFQESYDKVTNFTIKGYTGSAAEKYAKKNGFKFIPSNSTTAKKPATNPATKPASKTVKVGSTYTIGKNRYVVTSKSTVRYKVPVSKNITSIKIPKSVKINGKKYKVTAIAKKAFFNCKNLKKVTIKSPIKKIGKYAFYKCKKLKTFRIYSKKLTKNSVLTGAFKGISKKATFYVPKSKKAAYKKFFLKRGAKKTMKFETN